MHFLSSHFSMNSEHVCLPNGSPASPFNIPYYNIPPSVPVLAAISSPNKRERRWTKLHWGLVPAWKETIEAQKPLINARVETVLEKPSFREAIRKRRCLIPASGFFEWKKDGRTKTPHLIQFKTKETFAFAGIWERWMQSKQVHFSCAILTTEANALLQPIHHRMPIMLQRDHFSKWLDGDATTESMKEWAVPIANHALEAYPVSPLVNQTKHNSEECLAPSLHQGHLFE